MIRLVVVGLAIVFCGCTSEGLYSWGEAMEKSQCKDRAVYEEEYYECDLVERQSFEDYQRERKEAMEPIVDKDK